MPGPEILPLAEEHLDGAADLLAARHRRHRAAEPLLTSTYDDPAAARNVLQAAYAADDASGSVAVDGSRVVGYLLGAPKDDSWGRNIWVESSGHAVEEAETARALYGLAAARWLAEGRNAHYAMLPAHDTALVQAWFRLAFGWQHTHAIREPAEAGPVHAGLLVRQPTRAEIPTLARLDMALTDHQHLSPCFSSSSPDVYEERVADWEEDFDNPKYWNVAVEHDGRLVGSAVGCSLEVSSSHSGPAGPENAAFLGFAAVFPEARGLGVGRALGEAVSAWALRESYDSIVTDWRETNLLSSRAWRGLGYRDIFTRVHRLVGH